MKFKVIAKLLPHQKVTVDKQTDEWTHVRGGCGESEVPEGWVYTKYVREPDGSDIKTLPPPKEVEEPEPKCDIPGCDLIAPPPAGLSPPPIGGWNVKPPK
jgi:hypothetical protein